MEEGEVSLELVPCVAGFFEGDLLKVDFCAGPCAGECGEVCGDDVCDLGVAADGLALAHEDDGLAVWGDLDGAEGDGLGGHFAGLMESECCAGEAGAGAV